MSMKEYLVPRRIQPDHPSKYLKKEIFLHRRWQGEQEPAASAT